MNFPHLETAKVETTALCDFDAILSLAISRQGSSATARAVNANTKTYSAEPRDMIADRIHYFASENARSGTQFENKAAPYGVFFPTTFGKISMNSKYESAVNQDASIYSKEPVLEKPMSEIQADLVGQENSRTI